MKLGRDADDLGVQVKNALCHSHQVLRPFDTECFNRVPMTQDVAWLLPDKHLVRNGTVEFSRAR